ncbi:MAG: hypothetical protein ACYC2H_05805 [Thermoplasmatota archaeon]
MRRLHFTGLVVGVLLTLAAVAAPAGAHPESAAPSLRPDVLRAGHLPEAVAPHTQWQGFIDLLPESSVTAAYYQVCRVGQACFAPPAPATEVGNKSFRFDTSQYLANGRPVDYQPGWRLGVTWLLEERLPNGTTQAVRFPAGPDVLAPECQGQAALSCAEAHYLAFDLPAEERSSPGMRISVGLLALTLAAFAAARRR